MTFGELAEQTNLSRATVNLHLKKLESEGVVKKVYEHGRILNVLQLWRFDLVEWFLSQLESLDVPIESIEKGKTILSKEVLIASTVIYLQILNNYETIADKILTKARRRKITGISETYGFDLIPSQTSIPAVDISAAALKMEAQTSDTNMKREFEESIHALVKLALKESNPYSFSVVLRVFEIERFAPTEGLGFHLEKHSLQLLLSEDEEERFKKVLKWWFEEISQYVPSSGFLQRLAVAYINWLSECKQKGFLELR